MYGKHNKHTKKIIFNHFFYTILTKEHILIHNLNWFYKLINKKKTYSSFFHHLPLSIVATSRFICSYAYSVYAHV